MNSILYLKRYIKRYRFSFVIGAASVFIANWFGMLIPKYIGDAIDYVKSSGAAQKGLIRFAAIIVGFEVIQAVFTFFMRYIMFGAARNIEFDFRNDMFQKLQTLHSGYFDKQKVGDLMARATNDMDSVRMLLGPGILFMINTIFILPLALYQMLNVNISLTLYSIIPLIVIPPYVNIIGNQIHKKYDLVQDHFSTITAMVQENLAGIRVIKAFVQEKAQLKEFDGLNKEFVRRNLSLARLEGWFFPGMRLLGGFGILILIWLGGYRVIKGEVSLGSLAALIMIHIRLLWPMIAFGWIISLHQRGAASLKRIREVIEVIPEVRDDEEADHVIARIEGDIRIQNLEFTYPGETNRALKNISLEAPLGKTLGIVGPIGSGKSTLIRLLVRLYNPPPGTVFIDSHDILRIPLKILRRHIGYVFQEPFLFSDTIYNNIAFDVENPTREMVEEIASKVQFHEEILTFPKGYDTMLGERGINLSGGQKQRLALARALIKNPDILILDDTLSAVDTETEARILSVLKKELKKRTSIVISHRLSSVKNADEIIFLEQGRIVERGAHEELLKLGGLYAAIYDKQRLEEEIDKEQG
ncbi:ABC transporter ATP-binding protein [Candidatus Sumerlaeota bacterium]|nr:ABC transporter ATP-binding protein [Candidatus Sumerlaeota bacterium]